MAPLPWLRVLEAFLVQQLLRTPAFHRAVEKIIKGANRIRYGVPPEEMGGTRIDQPQSDGFMKHFVDEVKTQVGSAERQKSVAGSREAMRGEKSTEASTRGKMAAEDESADAVWQNSRQNASVPPKQGFMDAYMGALREQVRGNQNHK